VSLTRSEQMARIRGSGTKPETLLHEALLAQGVECTLNARVNPRHTPGGASSGPR
jgi:G:T-mismatch repair DNA endonuclease (very short patch repair protein)